MEEGIEVKNKGREELSLEISVEKKKRRWNRQWREEIVKGGVKDYN